MEDAPECTPSPSESAQPPSPAGEPGAATPRHSEDCARPLDTVPKKLCGYLSKFGGKGPIKGWKCRWFFYDERKCHLYYSRTAQDANPLDSIDLSSAVFDCKADAEEEGTFEIKTPSRVITLKVNETFLPFPARASFQGQCMVTWTWTVITILCPEPGAFPQSLHTISLLPFHRQG